MEARFAAVSRRLLVIGSTALIVLAGLVATPTALLAATDAQLVATLQLPEGEIDFPLEPGTLHHFDAEGTPFVVRVIDGCAVNGHYWVFGAGLGETAMRLTVFDERSGRSHRTVLPAFEPGAPIEAAFDPEALAICREGPTGGLPELRGTAVLTSATSRCDDRSVDVTLLSQGSEEGYQLLLRDGAEEARILRTGPVAMVGQAADGADVYLLTEGRTPRQVEGLLFSGDRDMLPREASLEAALDRLTPARVRRGFEAAKSMKVPKLVIDDLGLGSVACTYHVSLQLQTPGADAYLAQAGWIREGGTPLEPPELVPPRFSVDLVAADATTTALPLVGPYQGAPGEGQIWEHASDAARVEVIDGCQLGGSYWVVGAAMTDVPLQLTVTDSETGASTTLELEPREEGVAGVADTASLAACR